MATTLNTPDGNPGSPGGLTPITPYYLRLPQAGFHCPWTGLSRSKLNQLILPCAENSHAPPVKSLCLKKRGALRGTRLIVFESLMDHLEQQAEIGTNPNPIRNNRTNPERTQS